MPIKKLRNHEIQPLLSKKFLSLFHSHKFSINRGLIRLKILFEKQFLSVSVIIVEKRIYGPLICFRLDQLPKGLNPKDNDLWTKKKHLTRKLSHTSKLIMEYFFRIVR